MQKQAMRGQTVEHGTVEAIKGDSLGSAVPEELEAFCNSGAQDLD